MICICLVLIFSPSRLFLRLSVGVRLSSLKTNVFTLPPPNFDSSSPPLLPTASDDTPSWREDALLRTPNSQAASTPHPPPLASSPLLRVRTGPRLHSFLPLFARHCCDRVRTPCPLLFPAPALLAPESFIHNSLPYLAVAAHHLHPLPPPIESSSSSSISSSSSSSFHCENHLLFVQSSLSSHSSFAFAPFALYLLCLYPLIELLHPSFLRPFISSLSQYFLPFLNFALFPPPPRASPEAKFNDNRCRSPSLLFALSRYQSSPSFLAALYSVSFHLS